MKKKLHQIAGLFRAIRKLKGLSQADLAFAIGCSQRKISRIENNSSEINASELISFCRYANCTVHEIDIGIVDLNRKPKMQDIINIGDFNIPSRYGYNATSTVKLLYPLTALGNTELGPTFAQEFLSKHGLDPDYFLISDNPINCNLKYDFIDHLINKKIITPSFLDKRHEQFILPEIHLQHFQTYDRAKSPTELIMRLSNKSMHYSGNCKFKLVEYTDKNATFEISFGRHYLDYEPTDSVVKLMPQYRNSFFNSFLMLGGHHNGEVICKQESNLGWTLTVNNSGTP